jgi:hypothetical protein
MNQTAVIAALGLAGPYALFALMKNAQFPRPLTNNYQGGLTFSSGAIAAFGALMSAAKAHGWQVNQANFPTANWSMMATTPTGASYRPPSSFLFDY